MMSFSQWFHRHKLIETTETDWDEAENLVREVQMKWCLQCPHSEIGTVLYRAPKPGEFACDRR